MTPRWFRVEVICPVLAFLGDPYDTLAAEELLLGTALQESKLRSVLQYPRGPALGLFQMEPATHDDIYENWLPYRETDEDPPHWKEMLRSHLIFLGQPPMFEGPDDRVPPFAEELACNAYYACAMARAHYYRVPAALPDAGDLEGQAHYWKNYYNTAAGSGTVEEYIASWRHFHD